MGRGLPPGKFLYPYGLNMVSVAIRLRNVSWVSKVTTRTLSDLTLEIERLVELAHPNLAVSERV